MNGLNQRGNEHMRTLRVTLSLALSLILTIIIAPQLLIIQAQSDSEIQRQQNIKKWVNVNNVNNTWEEVRQLFSNRSVTSDDN
jgi:Na+-transporting NADH:ubiquinone oxidoreductase subunit NqrC